MIADTGLNADDFNIGSTTEGVFGGVIDDVRVYDRVLSQDEINRLYHLGATTKLNTTVNTQAATENGLLGHWTFDGRDYDGSEGSAEVRDRSGQGNHGNAIFPASVSAGPTAATLDNFTGFEQNTSASPWTSVSHDLGAN